MKVFVTGATGFVGSHLCDELARQGHEVFALIRSIKKAATLTSSVHVIEGDLSKESIEKWILKLPKDLDSIIHTAGIVHSFSSDEFYCINTRATALLIDALKEKFQQLHFVFISSLAAVGPNPVNQPHDETAELCPPSHYGKSKKDAELILEMMAPKEWKTTIIRPPMVIGPRDTAILDVYKMVASGVILSTGLQGMKKLYSFVCIYDLVEVIVSSLQKQEHQNDVFFSAHPEQVTFKQIIEQIKSQMNKKTTTVYIPLFVIGLVAFFLRILSLFIKVDIRLTPDKLKELGPMAWQCSGIRSQEKLEVQYKWDLKETIKLTYRDYSSRGWL